MAENNLSPDSNSIKSDEVYLSETEKNITISDSIDETLEDNKTSNETSVSNVSQENLSWKGNEKKHKIADKEQKLSDYINSLKSTDHPIQGHGNKPCLLESVPEKVQQCKERKCEMSQSLESNVEKTCTTGTEESTIDTDQERNEDDSASNNIRTSIERTGRSEDSQTNEKSEDSQTNEKSEDSQINEKSEDSQINEKSEDSQTNEKSEDSPTNEKSEDSQINKKSEDSQINKKSEDSQTNEKSEDSQTNEKSEDSQTNEKSEDSQTNEKFEDSQTNEKFEDSPTNEKSEDSQINEKSEDGQINKKSEDSQTNEKFEDSQINEKFEDSQINEKSEDSQTNEKSEDSQTNEKFEDSPTNEKSEDSQINEKSEDGQINKKSEDSQTNEKFEDSPTNEKSEDSQINKKSEDSQINKKSEDSQTNEKSEDSQTNEKFEDSPTNEKSEDSQINEKSEDGQINKKSEDSQINEKSEDSQINEKSEDSQTNEKSEDSQTNEKSEDSQINEKSEDSQTNEKSNNVWNTQTENKNFTESGNLAATKNEEEFEKSTNFKSAQTNYEVNNGPFRLKNTEQFIGDSCAANPFPVNTVQCTIRRPVRKIHLKREPNKATKSATYVLNETVYCTNHRLPVKYWCHQCNAAKCGTCVNVVYSRTCASHLVITMSEHVYKRKKTQMAKIKESSKAYLKELESNMSVLKQNEQITQFQELIQKERIQQEFVSLHELLIEEEMKILQNLGKSFEEYTLQNRSVEQTFGSVVDEEARLMCKSLDHIDKYDLYGQTLTTADIVLNTEWSQLGVKVHNVFESLKPIPRILQDRFTMQKIKVDLKAQFSTVLDPVEVHPIQFTLYLDDKDITTPFKVSDFFICKNSLYSFTEIELEVEINCNRISMMKEKIKLNDYILNIGDKPYLKENQRYIVKARACSGFNELKYVNQRVRNVLIVTGGQPISKTAEYLINTIGNARSKFAGSGRYTPFNKQYLKWKQSKLWPFSSVHGCEAFYDVSPEELRAIAYSTTGGRYLTCYAMLLDDFLENCSTANKGLTSALDLSNTGEETTQHKPEKCKDEQHRPPKEKKNQKKNLS